jgi:hypothetical protein
MKLLSKLILISVCSLAASAQAVVCQVAGRGVSPDLNCGPSGANGYIIPPADIPMCGATACFSLTVLPNVVISLPAKATPAWGVTPAQVQQLLPYNLLLNFEDNPNLDAAITSMGDVELARLSTELARNDVSGYTYSIMAYAGERLSAANLHRLQAAVGPAVFATALAYMPAATLSAYNASAMYAPIPLGVYWGALNPSQAATVPNDGDLYLYDILLDDKTASAGETSSLALANVSQYVNARVKNAVIIGLIIAGAAFALQVYDSPSMQALGNRMADWMFIQNAIMMNGTGQLVNQVVIKIPNLGNITPPDIDVPLPEMPPIEGDAPQNSAACPNNVCPV